MSNYKTLNCKNCVRRMKCFDFLSETELDFIDQNRVELHFKRGENICKQGSYINTVLFLYDGTVKIYIETQVRNLILSIVDSGNIIGLPSLFNDNLFHYSATAVDKSMICAINVSAFNQVILTNAPFAAEIIKLLNKISLLGLDRMVSLTQKQLHGRFADGLLFLFKNVYRSLKFKLSLSRKDLAELTGMSTESAVRLIKEFRNEGVITVEKKILEIIDLKKLEQIANNG